MTKKGFTLAEVLITLAIIGVIAAISVPSLIQKTNQAELITAWKKNFATFAQASENYAFDMGRIPSTDMANGFSNYIKVVKKCPKSDIDGVCWHGIGGWSELNGTTFGSTNNNVPTSSSFIASNGALYLFYTEGSCISPVTNYNDEDRSCGRFFVDVNGFKKPNTVGKDIYGANIYSDGTIMPYSRDTITMVDGGYNCNTGTNNGAGCSAEYLYSK